MENKTLALKTQMCELFLSMLNNISTASVLPELECIQERWYSVARNGVSRTEQHVQLAPDSCRKV